QTLRLLATAPLEEVFYTSTHFNPLVIAQDWRRRSSPEASERTQLLVKTNAMKTSRWLLPVRMAYSLAERALQQFDLADNSLIVLRKRREMPRTGVTRSLAGSPLPCVLAPAVWTAVTERSERSHCFSATGD